MKILYVAHNHPPYDAPLKSVGGMQRVSVHLLKELKKMEEVEVETCLQHTSWEGIGVKTALFLLKQVFRLPYKARESNADVILFSSMVTAGLAWFIRNKVNIPMVTINHGQDVTLPVRLYQWFVPKVFESLDGVISVSEATRQACIARGMASEKGVALGNGFDLERLQVFPDRQIARQELKDKFGIDLENTYMLLSVGRQVKRKGHEWFIRSVFPLVRKNCVFVAVGDGPEGEQIRETAEQSSEYDRIFLLGRQPEQVLKQCYSAADLFVMPNIPIPGDMEGFGIVLLEANMAGTPAIAADLEGIKDVITNGENGYRVPPLEEQKFADMINNIIGNGLAEFSDKTRSFVQDRFSWSRVARKYIEYLSTVIEKYQKTEETEI